MTRHLLMAAAAALTLCATAAHAAPPANIAAAVAAPDRPDADKTRDAARKPAETLAFFGLRPELTVIEIWPSVGAWWFEVLAPLYYLPHASTPDRHRSCWPSGVHSRGAPRLSGGMPCRPLSFELAM